ncbi:MAG: hypothetical protein K5756_05725 [Clostridiales bacterium]|nr:hypothetical protein [Clostridiales bacterium]
MKITKKFLSVFLAVLFVLPGLGGLCIPACAQEALEVIIVPDKTTVAPGETITYTLSIGPVSDLNQLFVNFPIPEGLTFIPLSESELAALSRSLGSKITAPRRSVV